MAKPDVEVLKDMEDMFGDDFPGGVLRASDEVEVKEEEVEVKEEEVVDELVEEKEEKEEEVVVVEDKEEVKDEETSDKEEEDAEEDDEEVEEADEDDGLEAIRKELDEALSKNVVPHKEEEQPIAAAPIEEVDFLESLGIDTENMSPTEFNAALNAVYKKAREESAAPQTDIAPVVQQQLQMQEVNRDFYEKHTDLAKYKNVVSRISEKLIAGLSDEDKKTLQLSDVLERVADKARKVLQIKIAKKKEEVEEQKKKDKPKFPKIKGSKGQKKSSPKLSQMEKEMDNMFNAVNS